jgi:hypothetical protein
MNSSPVSLKRVTFSVTDKCTLRCKKCAGYFPFYAENPWYPDMDYLIKSLDKVFEVLDEIGIVNIEGGEPLVRKDLPVLLRQFQRHLDRIGREIRFITNGTIMPTKELIAACKPFGDKVYFIVDNYGENLSKHSRDASKLLSDNGIRNELRIQQENGYYGGWIDLGNFEDRKYSDMQREHVYSMCKGLIIGAERQFYIKNGRITHCARSMRLNELGVISSDDYVDLFDDTSIEEKREKLLKIKQKPYFEACGYCNGFSSEAPRVPAGVQYTAEEMATLDPFDY